jgi:ribosomal protein L21
MSGIPELVYSSSQTSEQTISSQPIDTSIYFHRDYIPAGQRVVVTGSLYEPLILPLVENMFDEPMYYNVTQLETNDTFIVKVKSLATGGTEIRVCGSKLSLPDECVKINIYNIYASDTEILVEAVFIVDYKERCNNENYIKDAIMLARVAISFAYTYFKIDIFTLRDHSEFHCKTGHRNYRFHLAGRELLQHGKTWYHRHLNACILYPWILRKITEYIEFVNTKPPWSLLESALEQTNNAERLKPIWDKSASYKEFVLTLLDENERLSKVDDDTNQNCHILYPWFNNISSQYLQNLAVTDNFILRESFPFVEGLKVEILPKDEYASFNTLQIGEANCARVGWNSHGHWFTERIR